MRKYDYDVQNALISAWIAAIGPAPTLVIRTSDPPDSIYDANAGTALVSMTLPTVWQADPVLGVSDKSGTWSGTASATGVPRHFRMYSAGSPNDCKYQGLISKAFSLQTSSGSAANSNVLTFASTTSITVGQAVFVNGLPTGTTVREKDATTVTLSKALTAAISSGAYIYFGDVSGDMFLSVDYIETSDDVSVTRHRVTGPGR